jgi:hypothetical protein
VNARIGLLFWLAAAPLPGQTKVSSNRAPDDAAIERQLAAIAAAEKVPALGGAIFTVDGEVRSWVTGDQQRPVASGLMHQGDDSDADRAVGRARRSGMGPHPRCIAA